jgi:mycothiol synthase
MGFNRFATLEVPHPAPGYGLRRFRPGDEDAWLEILAAGEFGQWNRARLAMILESNRAPMPLAGIFFATYDDRPVGAACTFLYRRDSEEISELGWVAVHPAYRGRGHGRQVCQAMLCFARDLGHRYSFLLTDDYRLAAIKTYLRLGFQPEIVDASHPERWAMLWNALRGHEWGDASVLSLTPNQGYPIAQGQDW